MATQHQVVAGHSHIERRHGNLIPGPISVGPTSAPHIEEAIKAGGGSVVPLGAETRGLVWLINEMDSFAAAMDKCPNCQWVQLPWAGVDRFAPVLNKFAGRTDMVFTSAKGAYGEPVAEHAVALTLGSLRLLAKRIRASRWEDTEMGISLYGLNVVVVGAGGIAAEYMRLLAPYRCNFSVVRNRPVSVPGVEKVVTFRELHSVLPTADVVMIAAPLTPDTTSLFGKKEFQLMKKTAVIVNVGRGPIINTDALVEALKNNEIGGAGLDVTDPEPLPEGHYLWTDQRVIITPHSADTEEMCKPLLAARTKANVQALLTGTPFEGVVDLQLGY